MRKESRMYDTTRRLFLKSRDREATALHCFLAKLKNSVLVRGQPRQQNTDERENETAQLKRHTELSSVIIDARKRKKRESRRGAPRVNPELKVGLGDVPRSSEQLRLYGWALALKHNQTKPK